MTTLPTQKDYAEKAQALRGPLVTSGDPIRAFDPMLKDRECADMLGFSVPTFWRRVADGTIPRPVKIGRTSRWPKSDIDAVIEQAIAERDAA